MFKVHERFNREQLNSLTVSDIPMVDNVRVAYSYTYLLYLVLRFSLKSVYSF